MPFEGDTSLFRWHRWPNGVHNLPRGRFGRPDETAGLLRVSVAREVCCCIVRCQRFTFRGSTLRGFKLGYPLPQDSEPLGDRRVGLRCGSVRGFVLGRLAPPGGCTFGSWRWRFVLGCSALWCSPPSRGKQLGFRCRSPRSGSFCGGCSGSFCLPGRLCSIDPWRSVSGSTRIGRRRSAGCGCGRQNACLRHRRCLGRLGRCGFVGDRGFGRFFRHLNDFRGKANAAVHNPPGSGANTQKRWGGLGRRNSLFTLAQVTTFLPPVEVYVHTGPSVLGFFRPISPAFGPQEL